MEQGLKVKQRELHRMHVVQLTLEGREGVGRGGRLLGISSRQMKRLRRKMKRMGAVGLLHGNRGREPWNRSGLEVVEQVIGLAQGRYKGLNDTHLTEKLNEKEGIELSRSTIRAILRRAGIYPVRRRRPKRHYQRRERRAQRGALLLWDGSPHRWLGPQAPQWTLVAVMDDATGELLWGVFAEQEDAQSYLICLKQLLVEKGIPLSIYMDRHGIFRRNDDHWSTEEELAGEQTPTQVGQALRALGIEPIFALSPQAKGRIERLFGTLQDRLVQELRLAGIATPKQATAFLNGPFRADFNRRFAKSAKQSQSAWRPVPRGVDLDRICSFRYDAVVGNDNAVRLGGIILDIPAGPRRRGYAKARVEVRQLLDGRWRVYYKDTLLLQTQAPSLETPLRTKRRKLRLGPTTPDQETISQRKIASISKGDIFAKQLRGHFA